MFYTRSKSDDVRFEMTPLLDIIFILLIFFAVSTTLITNKHGMKLDLPQANSVNKEEKGMTISVTKTKKIMIDKQEVSIDKLQYFVKEKLSQDYESKIILNADRNLAYFYIVEILDQIRLGGGLNIILQAEKITTTNK
jgi:biopolymer transport protein ExbD